MNRKAALREIRKAFQLDERKWQLKARRVEGVCTIYTYQRGKTYPTLRTVFAKSDTWAGAFAMAHRGAALLNQAGVAAR